MAYAHGVTRDDVFNIASEIFADGKNPTQVLVRAKLGKGSFSTISKYLSEWRKEQSETEPNSIVELGEIPDEISDILLRFYSTTKQHIESDLVADQVSTLEAENSALRSQVADYEQVKAELVGLRYAYQETMLTVEKLSRENERLLIDKAELLSNNQALTQERDTALATVEKLNLEIQTLNQESDRVPATAKQKQSRARAAKSKKVDQLSTWEERADSFVDDLV